MRPKLVLGLALLVASPVLLAPQGASEIPLGGVATIYRDGFGVPHIYASDGYTLAYANGYVQAQDRLFAMDALRHIGRGTGASVLGPSLLEMDFAARRDFGTEGDRARELAQTSEEFQLLLQGFADGVNRALLEMTATGELPAEFLALQHVPEPWTPLDTVAVAKFLLQRFGSGGGNELDNARLLGHLQGTLGAEAGEAAFGDQVWGLHPSHATIPGAAYEGPVSLPKRLADLPRAQREALAAAQASEPFGVPRELPFALAEELPLAKGWKDLKWGSNALLVGPGLARDGRAMVGGGPQTGYFNPQILYEVGLHSDQVDVVGVGVMGAPGVVLGRAERFAWTVTSGVSDEEDVVALPAAGERAYLWDGQVRKLDCRTEAVASLSPPAVGVAAPQAFTMEVCRSHLGPVLAWTRAPDGAPQWFFARQAVLDGRDVPGAERWLSIDTARNLGEFREAFDDWPFTFNFHYAGPEGICYFHVGQQPVRNPFLDPRLPRPAGEAWNWSRLLRADEMPRDCDPAQGYYANWNNLPQQGWPSGDNREVWGSVHRVERLDRAMRAGLAASPDGKLDLLQVQAILRDAATRDPLAPKLVPQLMADAPPAAKAALQAWMDDDFPWSDADGDGVYDHLGHAYYDAVRTELQQRVLEDELGPFTRSWDPDPRDSDDPHAGDHGRHDTHGDALLLDALRGTTEHAWCDILDTDPVEACRAILAAAFVAVGDPKAEEVHRSPFTAIGAGPAYTLPMTNRATYYHFHVGADTATSRSSIAPGQSGHLNLLQLLEVVAMGSDGPPHMRDQLPLYERFGTKPVPFTAEQAAAVSGEPELLYAPRPRIPL